MRRLFATMIVGLALLAAPLFAGVAEAGTYLKVSGSLSDFSEVNISDVGYAGEVGWDTGILAFGIEASNNVHNDENIGAGALNITATPWDWVIHPYATVGTGATFDGDPLVQYGGGLIWKANEGDESGSFGIYAGYEARRYLDSAFNYTDDDGYAKLGMLLTF